MVSAVGMLCGYDAHNSHSVNVHMLISVTRYGRVTLETHYFNVAAPLIHASCQFGFSCTAADDIRVLNP